MLSTGARATAWLAALMLGGCAHGSGADAARVSGLDAVERWTASFVELATDLAPDAYRWWIGETVLERARGFTVQRALLPPPAGPRRQGVPPRRAMPSDSAQFVLAACAAHRFAPMILQRADSKALRELGERLGDEGDADLREGTQVMLTHRRLEQLDELSRDVESLYLRVRGERRDRPPSVTELGLLLVYGAEVTMFDIESRDMIDPGHNVYPAHHYHPPVPLTLAPLYALSAGVPVDEVAPATQECLRLLSEAQRDPRRRVLYRR